VLVLPGKREVSCGRHTAEHRCAMHLVGLPGANGSMVAGHRYGFVTNLSQSGAKR
jgi:hypothetical protein